MMLALPLLMLSGLLGQTPTQSTTSVNQATLIAPFMGENVIAVAHLDLQRLDFAVSARRLGGPLAKDKSLMQAIDSANAVIGSLTKAGAAEIFVMLDPSVTRNLPLFVVTLKPGSDPRPVQTLLKSFLPPYGDEPGIVEVMEKLVVGGPARAVAAARTAKNAPRAELATAFAASSQSPAKILIVPGLVQRKALEEAVTTLPPEFGGGPITDFTQGFAWGTLMLNEGEQPSLKLSLHAKEKAATGPLAALVRHGKTFANQWMKQNTLTLPLAGLLDKLDLVQADDQLVMEIGPELMGELFIPTVQALQESDRRAGCVSNLKQIGFAMLDYHEAKKAFPRQASLDKAGKPLLSWRVQILPYLGQQALYDQFHHDEPWDSPHNKTLISKMPAVFVCPGSRHPASEGKTCYLVPYGERTVLAGEKGGKLGDIYDGTTRTMMAADMADDAAVTWSRPDDWKIGNTIDVKPLFGHHRGGTNILSVDGSVHFIKETIKQTLLKALITRDGGEAISPDTFSH